MRQAPRPPDSVIGRLLDRDPQDWLRTYLDRRGETLREGVVCAGDPVAVAVAGTPRVVVEYGLASVTNRLTFVPLHGAYFVGPS